MSNRVLALAYSLHLSPVIQQTVPPHNANEIKEAIHLVRERIAQLYQQRATAEQTAALEIMLEIETEIYCYEHNVDILDRYA